jgi:hypothetical protein
MGRLLALLMIVLAGCDERMPSQSCVGACILSEICPRDDVACTCMRYGKDNYAWVCGAAGEDLSAVVDMRGRDLSVTDGRMGD